MIELLQYEFMRNALAAGLLASVICGVMGSLVVVNRMVFISGGIAHAAYGGIGMAFFLGWPRLVCTLGFSLAAATLMAGVTLNAKHRADTIVGVVWALGMATGILLLDLTPGYNVDVMSYLFGSILTVPVADVWVMLAAGCIICGLVSLFYPALLTLSYDADFARIRGVPVTVFYFTLIALVALTIVLVIRVVGLILVIALLTIAPLIAERHTRSLKHMMAGAGLWNLFFTLCGLWLSWAFNLTAGAAIIWVAGLVFFLFLAAERLLSTRQGA